MLRPVMVCYSDGVHSDGVLRPQAEAHEKECKLAIKRKAHPGFNGAKNSANFIDKKYTS
jgi:hypothetical protein